MTLDSAQTSTVASNAPALHARDVSFAMDGHRVLDGMDLTVSQGESVAIVGRSGSGKSTLLHILAGLTEPDEGVVAVAGTELTATSAAQRARLRIDDVGLVFQFSELVPELSLRENVALPALLAGVKRRSAMANAVEHLARVGLNGDVIDRRPHQVSGGQCQRAAIARAISRAPAVILADEPTGALDPMSAETVMDVLTQVCAGLPAALVIVTHDHGVASRADRVVELREARLHAVVAAR